jgi:SAM-dependent methyltransferase
MKQAEYWDDLAAVDPLWAVLSTDGKRNGGWDLDEFFATGENDVAAILAAGAELGRPARTETALDFGCGVGRLTRALASRFTTVTGVDASPKMIEQARRLNAETANATFEPADEPPAGPLDLVLAQLVLQHLPSKALAREYIERLIRATAPDGLTVFQIPAHLPLAQRIQPRRRAYAALRGLKLDPERLLAAGLHPISMLALPEPEVRAVVDAAGAEIARVEAGSRYYVHHRSR